MKMFLPITGTITPDESKVSSMLSADYGCIYNSDDKGFNLQPHTYDINNIGNLCVQLKSKGITTIITESMPLLTYLLCLEMGLKIFKAKKTLSLQDNIRFQELGQLEIFSAKDTRIDGDCMGACSGCKSTCSS